MNNGESRTADAIPLVSVITCFLDAERYLGDALESVFSQTWPQWELLLVDDGSSDGSTAIARDMAALHRDRVCYLEHAGHANRGISASRNVGAAHARGAYLAFLDADDVFLPEKLERQVIFLAPRSDIDAVFGDSLYWYSWTGDPTDLARDRPRHLQIAANTTFGPGELLPRLLRRLSFTPATCSLLVRRTAFERIGGFEESFRGIYEDQAFLYKMFFHCRTHMASDVWDRYRQHPDSCCAVAIRHGIYSEKRASPAQRHFLDWFVGYLRRQERQDLRLRSLVEARRWRQRHPAVVHFVGMALSRASRVLHRSLKPFRGAALSMIAWARGRNSA